MEIFYKYHYPFSVLGLSEKVQLLLIESEKNNQAEILKKIFGYLDLTSLNSTDSTEKIKEMCLKVNDFQKKYPAFPNVAAICVYPNLVSTVKKNLKVNTIAIASVAAGFPSSQTFLKVKIDEVNMAIENGANEIDIVISLGEFLQGNYQVVFDEIAAIKETMGHHHLKVILETGALIDPLKIWEASILAMHAGADFIKTSTGKIQPAATIEAAVVMTEAIKSYSAENGKKVGFKPAGGISTRKDALNYYTTVESILGVEWLNSKLFRIGASSLANNLLNDFNEIETGNITSVNYF